MGALRRSIKLEQLPFQNRRNEERELVRFIEANAGTEVLLLVGEGGIGKSRLCDEVRRIHGQKFACARVLASGAKDLVLQISEALFRCLEETTPQKGRRTSTLIVKSYVAVVAGVVPLVLKLLGLNAMFRFLNDRTIFQEILFPRFLRFDLRERILTHRWKLLVSELSKAGSVVLVLEDLHEIEQANAEDLLAFLYKVFDDERLNLRVIAVSRGITEQTTASTLFITNLSEAGILRTQEIDRLPDTDIREICINTFENHEETGQIAETCKGNPQVLTNQIVKLNLAGLLTRHRNLILVPPTEDQLIETSKSIWDLYDGRHVERTILVLLSFSRDGQQVSTIARLSNFFLFPEEQIRQSLRSLVEQRVVRLSFKAGEEFARFEHDLLRAQIYSGFLQSSESEKASLSGIAVDIFESEIRERYGITVSEIVRRSQFSSIRNSLPRDLLSSLLILLQVYKLAGRGEVLGFGLGLMGAAKSAKDHDIVVGASEVIVHEANEKLDPGEKAFQNYLDLTIASLHETRNYRRILSLNIPKDQVTTKREFYTLMARSALKETKNVSRSICEYLEETYPSLDSVPPLTALMYSVALQESGAVDRAATYFRRQYRRLSGTNSHKSDFLQLCNAAPLFLPTEEGAAACSEAAKGFEGLGNKGYNAMALNNLGYCEAGRGNYRQAAKHFSRSYEVLAALKSHDQVFPQNNYAAMLIIEGRAMEARDLLYQCMFQTVSQDYISAFRINLAIANAFLGLRDERGGLEALRRHRAILGHSYMESLLEYAISFVRLEIVPDPITQDVLCELASRMRASPYPGPFVEFWNRLSSSIAERHGLSPEIIDLPERLPVGAKMAPHLSLVRPAFLICGHA